MEENDQLVEKYAAFSIPVDHLKRGWSFEEEVSTEVSTEVKISDETKIEEDVDSFFSNEVKSAEDSSSEKTEFPLPLKRAPKWSSRGNAYTQGKKKFLNTLRECILTHKTFPAFTFEASYKYSPEIVKKVVEFYQKRELDIFTDFDQFQRDILEEYNVIITRAEMANIFNRADRRNVDHMSLSALRKFFDVIIANPKLPLKSVGPIFGMTPFQVNRWWTRYIFPFIQKSRNNIVKEDFDNINLDLIPKGPRKMK